MWQIIDNSAILVSYKLNSPKQKFRKIVEIMEEKTTKADRWIDFLVPWNNAYYFKTRRMQTSIKVVILMPLILALLYRAMCIADKFIDETSTLGNLFLWVGIWFAILFIIYLALAHTVLTVAHDSLLEMFLDWSKNRHKNQEVVQASAVLPVSQESTKKDVEECTKEELEEKEVPEESAVAESSVAEVAKTNAKTVSYVLNLPDPAKLEQYIKENEDIYSNGDGAAILFDVLVEKEVIKNNQTAFCDWLNGLVDSVGHSGLSEARKRVLLKKSEGEDEIVEKYDELFNEIIKYII